MFRIPSLTAVLLTLPLWLMSQMAHALEIKPYSAAALQTLQAEGKPVAVHFHADWCPTCRAQSLSFQAMKQDAQLKDVTLLVANYDTEAALKQRMQIRAQSTLVVFRGKQETARQGGYTEVAPLKAALLTAVAR
ncbi:thioredoxin family protein [Leeia sp.]|uniref:thioredoxin family protein n=1 Tax=Leeia sp. TaxID=2884678 RepID=UPI0035B2907F